MDFKKAVVELEKVGISGVNIYLIDLLPLIDLMWADGKIQFHERVILETYTKKRIDSINENFSGAIRLDQNAVRKFFAPFLETRPDSVLIHTVRHLLNQVLMSSSDQKWNDNIRNSLLATALDIASSNVTKYPYEVDERFSLSEKECFFSLLKSLDQTVA